MILELLDSADEKSILTSIITNASAWKKDDFKEDRSWILQFSTDDIAEIELALRNVQKKQLSLGEIVQTEFPLPNLGPRIRSWLSELEQGRGFLVVRGLPVERYSVEESSIIFWGIGSHLGTGVSQNSAGDLVGHVRDQGFEDYRSDVQLRGYQTRAPLPFHTDSVDVVGLLCLQKAKEGGESSIVSSVTLHNNILSHYREYLGLLYREFFWDRRGEEAPGDTPTYRGSIYSYHAGYLSCRPALLDYIFSAQEKTGIALSRVEREAIEIFVAMAQTPDLRLDMMLEPGDIQLLHNSVILHARTHYVDFDEPARKRHLLRLWINVPDGRPLAPDAFATRRVGVPPTRRVVAPR